MRPYRSWGLAVLMLAGSQAGAQETYLLPVPGYAPPAPIWLAAQDKTAPQPPATPPASSDQPAQPPAAQAQPPATDVFTQAPSTGGEAMEGPNPRMIGDFYGFCAMRTIDVPAVQTISVFRNVLQQVGNDSFGKPIFQTTPVLVSTTQTTVRTQVTACVPIASSAIGFKIADNQSPMPEDRVFFTYNYFNNMHVISPALANGQTITQQITVNNLTTITNTVVPGSSVPRLDLNGEVIGFEKTLFDGRASVGMRLPLFQQQGDGSFSQQDFGDLGVFFNIAFYADPVSGNVLSGGMLVTAPTGPSIDTTIGNVHSTYLQPFVGYRLNLADWYIQGFSSVATPTNSNDVTAMFNDVGIGYWLYRGAPNRLLSAIIPTFEAHVTTPLNHRNMNDPVNAPDELDLTAGVHLGFGRRSLLTLGVSTPVTGPRPFNIEAIAQLNLAF